MKGVLIKYFIPYDDKILVTGSYIMSKIEYDLIKDHLNSNEFNWWDNKKKFYFGNDYTEICFEKSFIYNLFNTYCYSLESDEESVLNYFGFDFFGPFSGVIYQIISEFIKHIKK